MRYLFIYLFVHLCACKDANVNRVESNTTYAQHSNTFTFSESSEILIGQKGNSQTNFLIDTLSLEQVSFNNTPLKFKYSDLLKIKVDSIVDSNWECGNPFGWSGETFKVHYSKGSEYVTNAKEVVLRSAHFNDGTTLTLHVANEKIVLNNTSTVEEINTLFPNSETVSTPNNYYTYVSLNKQVPENHWEFHYNSEGYLIRFELHWWLC